MKSYINIFHKMCGVPTIIVFCSYMLKRWPGIRINKEISIITNIIIIWKLSP
jgi:hypothetical protein